MERCGQEVVQGQWKKENGLRIAMTALKQPRAFKFQPLHPAVKEEQKMWASLVTTADAAADIMRQAEQLERTLPDCLRQADTLQELKPGLYLVAAVRCSRQHCERN